MCIRDRSYVVRPRGDAHSAPASPAWTRTTLTSVGIGPPHRSLSRGARVSLYAPKPAAVIVTSVAPVVQRWHLSSSSSAGGAASRSRSHTMALWSDDLQVSGSSRTNDGSSPALHFTCTAVSD